MSENIQRTTRREAEDQLVNRAIKDEAFRQQLISNPKSTISSELGIQLPAGLEVKVIEESPNTFYLVLPPAAAGEEGELSDLELEAVAAGCDKSTTTKSPASCPRCMGGTTDLTGTSDPNCR